MIHATTVKYLQQMEILVKLGYLVDGFCEKANQGCGLVQLNFFLNADSDTLEISHNSGKCFVCHLGEP